MLRSFTIVYAFVSFLLLGCGNEKATRNPPEIVSRSADTVFNDIPGEHLLGGQAFNYNIVEVLENIRKTEVFISGLKKAGLIDTLKSEGPFTVFAPADEAFPGFDSDTSNTQTKNPAPDINFTAKMLKAYIVPQRINAEDFVDGSITVNNLNGQPLALKLENGKIIINDKIRVTENLNASNGTIHEITQLLDSPR